MEFSYIPTPREFDAGILFFGDDVSEREVIPPNAVNYKILGWCPSQCTNTVCIRQLYSIAVSVTTRSDRLGLVSWPIFYFSTFQRLE